MQQVEKRELFEQERKIFEAGVQRADKRSGSFSFLTWSFFIAPLIACEEFLAAPFKSALAEHEDATAAHAGAGPQRTNGELPSSDPAKPGAEDERPKGPAASSETHGGQLDPASLPAEHTPRPGTGGGEAVAVASYGGEGGGGEDAISFKHHARTSADASRVSCGTWGSADSDFGNTESSGGATLESIRPNVLYESFSPSVVSSFPVLGDLYNEVVVGITPVEAIVPPALATASDSVSTLPNDVVGAIAPVAAAQPTFTTLADTVTLPDDAVGTIAAVEAAVPPALATMTGAVSMLPNNVAGAIAPLEATAQPTPTTLADTAGTLPDGMVGAIAPVEAAVMPALATATDTAGTLPNDVAGAIAPLEALPPTLAILADVGNLPDDVFGTLAPVAAAVPPALATATDTVSTLPNDVVGAISPV
ncbi:hypothetical protein GA0061098_103069, partial [Bradyrhizobium shewense]